MTEQTKEALLAIEKAKKEYNEKVGKKYPVQQELPDYVIVNTHSNDFEHAVNQTVDGVNDLLKQSFVPIGGVQIVELMGPEGALVVVSQSMVRRPEVAK